MTLILASASAIRSALLHQAGIAHEIDPAHIDEAAYKAAGGGPAEIALGLAERKALAVGARRPRDWIIGGDSVASVDGRLFDKPRTREEAAEHLRAFSGQPLTLTSAVALCEGTRLHWSHCAEAPLQVRELSQDFIQTYLDAEWPDVGGCVGVFRMEGLGVTLFEAVDGDHFTILGMPLIPLLGALRRHGLAAS